MTNLEVWEMVDMKGLDDAIFEGYLDPAEIEDEELATLVGFFQGNHAKWRRLQDIIDDAYYGADKT